MSKPIIDMVYTWVNGESLDYQALCRQYALAPSDLNPERYRDTYQLLKYSLRSVDLFVPWIRNIYLFTCRPQIPDWLNTNHPKIHVIHHDEIIDPEFLPTFNSHVIESYLYTLPNRSDYLLYVSDDMLFGRMTEQTDFLQDDGRIRLYGTFSGERLKFRIYNRLAKLFSFGFMEHIPILIHKPIWEALMGTPFKADIHRTRTHKFRQDYDVWMDRLYRYYLLTHHRLNVEIVPALELLKYHRFHKMTNHLTIQKKGLRHLKDMRPKFYAMNDDQGLHPDKKVISLIQSFLDAYYPENSSFEI